MVILDQRKLQDTIISGLAKFANGKALVVADDGQINSLLVSYLAYRTNIKTYFISFGNQLFEHYIEITTQQKTLEVNGLGKILVDDLNTTEHAFDISGDVLMLGAIYAIADKNNAVVVSSMSMEDLCITRKAKKFGKSYGDVYPIAQAYKSEIYDALYTMWELSPLSPDPSKIVDSAYKKEKDAFKKLYDFSYDELEWGHRLDQRNKIISGNIQPTQHKDWAIYTGRQKEVLAKMHFLDKKTLHKQFGANYINLRGEGILK